MGVVKDGVAGVLWFDVQLFFVAMQLRELMRPHGFHVVDALEPSRIVREYLPHLLYYRTTMDTVHQVETLVRQKIVPANRICALIGNADGLQPLRELAVREKRAMTKLALAFLISFPSPDARPESFDNLLGSDF